MVRKILGRIAAPIRGLHQAAYLLAALTLASQAISLLRDRIFAHSFGAGQTLDLYYAAFRVPDLVFALVSSLVSAYILIPLISGTDRDETKRVLSEASTFLVVGGGVLCLVLAIFMPQFLSALYPTLAAGAQGSAFVLLSRILLIQPILLGLTGVISSVTQVHRRFILFALSPILYNLGIIFGTVWFYPLWGLPGIGLGVVIGAIAYLSIHLPVLARAGVMPVPRLPQFRTLFNIVRHSVPRSLALGMKAIILLALTAIASRIATGSVTVFTFANNLEAVPMAIIGSSYAIAAFPALAEASARGAKDEFANILASGARQVLLWSLIAFGLILVLRAHIVRVILGSGAFDWDATRLTAALLAACTVSLFADALELLLSRALYAARQSWRPFLYQVATGAFTILLALWFLSMPDSALLAPLSALLKVSSVPHASVILLAFAASLGQIFLIILSLIALRNVAPGLTAALATPARDGVLAAVAAGVAAHYTLVLVGGLAPLTSFAAVLAQGFVAGLIGLFSAAIVLYLLKNNEFMSMSDSLAKLIRRDAEQMKIVAPSSDEPLS